MRPRTVSFRRPSVAFADYDINDRKGSISATLILLYGTAHVLVGTVLTLADAFSSEKGKQEDELDHKYYLEIFLLVEYLMSILGIILLQTLVYVSERRSHHWHHHHSDIEDLQDNQKHCRRKFNFSKVFKFWRRLRQRFPGSTKSRLTETEEGIAVEALTMREHEDGPVVPSSTEELGETEASHPRFQSIELSLMGTRSTSLERLEVENMLRPKPLRRQPTKTSFKLDVEQFSDTISEPAVNHVESPWKRKTHNSEPFSPNMLNNNQGHQSHAPYRTMGGHHDGPTRHHKSHMKMVYRDKEGVNLYLRLGAVGFGFGVMVYDGFKISDHINSKTSQCLTALWIPKYTVHFIYTFIQTYFIFKFHRMVFNCYKTMVRFILIHLATCNVVQWLKTIVFEIHEESKREMHHKITQSMNDSHVKSITHYATMNSGHNSSVLHAVSNTVSGGGEPYHGCIGYSDKLAHYLFPCAIEYSLIAGAMCYKLFQKVEGELTEVSQHSLMARSRTNSGTSSLSDSSASLDRHVSSECDKSHRGIFMGMLLVVVTVVAMGLFFFLKSPNGDNYSAVYIYQITKIILQIISGSACVWAFYQIRDLKFRHLSEGEAFDANLLLIGFSGMLVYNMFLVLPALEAMKEREDYLAELYASKAAFEMIQSLVQVFFIVEASRRCARDMTHVRNKPGRSLVTFLLVSNLALWVINTFLVKTADQSHTMHQSYYGDLPWNIVTSIFLPLIIFYRFHSTVCLSDIWVKIYELH